MATWDNTTLTTTATLTTHEYEITNLVNSTNLTNKITLAKSLLKNQIEKMLREMNRDWSIDYSAGEELINVIANKDIYTNSCDYKTLELIYLDLSQGNQDTIYYQKMVEYRERFLNEFNIASSATDYDWDQDGTTDEYKLRSYKVARVSR